MSRFASIVERMLLVIFLIYIVSLNGCGNPIIKERSVDTKTTTDQKTGPKPGRIASISVEQNMECASCHNQADPGKIELIGTDDIVSKVDCSSCHRSAKRRSMEATKEDRAIGKMDCLSCHDAAKDNLEPITIVGKDGAMMVLVPGGGYSMGAHDGTNYDNETSPTIVHLEGFYIDAYEVTNAQYAVFLNKYGRHKDEAGHVLLDVDDENCLIEKIEGIYKPKAGHENHPVASVSWYGAAAYTDFYGKRLPTEAEWEKAARGGLQRAKYPWGDDHPDGTQCNFADKCTGYSWVHWDANDTYSHTAPVGSFPPNGYGLYDIAGNVWEWCSGKYDPDYYNIYPESDSSESNAAKPPTSVEPTSPSVMRGGSWQSGPSCQRVARRAKRNAYITYQNAGFRCVMDVPAASH